MYTRISKSQAKKLWSQGKTIYLCPSNFRPGGMWNIEIPVNIAHYRDNAKWYAPDDNLPTGGALWKGTIENTAWELMYNNWASYNTNYEMGYYAHYYVKS